MAKPKSYVFDLYIADQTPQSVQATNNLKRFCKEEMPGLYKVRVWDLQKDPSLAFKHDICAVPTLIKRKPGPQLRCLGALTDLKMFKERLHLT